jgi:beta-lactamase regulating signal transducer with metallopeptidase domain
MMIPMEWTANASSQWLGALFEGAMRVTLLMALAWLAATTLRRAPAAARHLVWTFALVAALGLPLATWLVPAWTLDWAPAPTIATTFSSVSVESPPSTVAPEVSSSAAAIADDPAQRVEVTSQRRAAPAFDPRTLLPLVPVVWLIGVFLLLARRALATIRVHFLARRATPMVSPGWRMAIARHAASLGIERVPSLLVSDEADVPMTFGTLRPVVMVPNSALDWSPARRDLVLLHELGHIRRRDTLALLLGQLAAALYWFHPLVWVAQRRQRMEAETACDDQVLRAGALPSAYATELLDIATAASPREVHGAAALAMARRSQLEGRLLAILDPRCARGAVGRRFLAMTLLLTVVSTGALAAARAGRSATPVPEAPRPPETPKTSETPRVATPAPAAPAAPATPGLLAAAASDKKKSSRFSLHEDDETKTINGTWTDDGRSAKYKSRGAIRFNEALNDVEAMPEGGSLTVEEDRAGHDRRAEFRKKNGQIERKYWVDGESTVWNDSAREWFGAFLLETDRRSALLAGQRFPRLMKAGGTNAVLSEIALMPSDYAKSVYYRLLMKSDAGPEDLRKAIAQAGKEVQSDYELARILSEAAERNALNDPATRSAFMAAADGLESDYEHARVLMMLVERPKLDPELAVAALQSTARISSDYECARLLVAMAEKRNVAQGSQREYLRTARAMESDYEKGRALRALIEHSAVSSDNVSNLLLATSSMSSDYERANVLVSIAESIKLDDFGRAAYIESAKSMESSYERQRALAALGEHGGD